MKILAILALIFLSIIIIALVAYVAFGFNIVTWIIEGIEKTILAFFKAIFIDWWYPF